jgi:hypothetical protein
MDNPIDSFNFNPPEKPVITKREPGKFSEFTPRSGFKPLDDIYGQAQKNLEARMAQNKKPDLSKKEIDKKSPQPKPLVASRQSVRREDAIKFIGKEISGNQKLKTRLGLHTSEDVKKFASSAVGKNPWTQSKELKRTFEVLGGKGNIEEVPFISDKQRSNIKHDPGTKYGLRDIYGKITGKKWTNN